VKEAIQNFISLLRKPGIRISISETLDCLKGLECIDFIDKSQFKSLLSSTLIKNRRDIPEFNRIFHLYFEKYHHPVEEIISMELLQSVHEILGTSNGQFSDLFKNFMIHGIEGIVPYIFNLPGNQGSPYTIMTAYSTMKMGERLSVDRWESQLDSLISLLKAQGIHEDDIGDFHELMIMRFDQLSSLVNDLIESEKKNWKSWKTVNSSDNLMERGFRSLDLDNVEEIREAVHQLMKRIRDEYALREKRLKIGKIDIKRTLRNSQKYGGVPVDLYWKSRKKSKGRIIALCDVSNSVRSATRFMLTLLYSLQDQFSKVRSFVFVSELGEVTRFFENNDIHTGIQEALTKAGISYDSYTDYGNVLVNFYDNYFDAVNSRTTLIIIGDGRNNYSRTIEWVLEKIKSRARRIIWLNPEQKMSWGFGDSAALIYKKHCTEMKECWKVSQLMKIINTLL
jgi:uncharacterized protein with von Willebrand factor type A (vWA) domain